MVQTTRSIIGASIIAIFVGACSSAENPQNTTVRTKGTMSQIINLNAATTSTVDVVVEAAYEIAMGPGFMYAREFADRALALSPNHPSATYLKALVEWTPHAAGIMIRPLPLFEKLDPTGAQAQGIRASAQRLPPGDYKNFLTGGNQDVTSENDAQNYVTEVEKSLVTSRTLLESIANAPDFSAPFFVHSGPADAILKDCGVTRLAPGVFELRDCKWKQKIPRKVSFADVRATKLIFGSLLSYSALFTSYRLEGSASLAAALADSRRNAGRELTEREQISLIQSQPNLLKLRDGRRLGDVLGFGVELRLAIVEADRLRTQVCAKESTQSRTDFIFPEGFCISAKERKIAQDLQAWSSGPVTQEFTGWSWREDTAGTFTPISPLTLLAPINILPVMGGSVSDIKTLLPDAFNACGRAINIPDPSFGGLFPDRNVVDLARLTAPDFLRPRCN